MAAPKAKKPSVYVYSFEIVQANHLPNEGPFSDKPETYVRVLLNSKMATTKVYQTSTVSSDNNPIFDVSGSFFSCDDVKSIEFRVYDKDTGPGNDDDIIGVATIQKNQFKDKFQTLSLVGDKCGDGANLTVKVTRHEFTDPTFTKDAVDVLSEKMGNIESNIDEVEAKNVEQDNMDKSLAAKINMLEKQIKLGFEDDCKEPDDLNDLGKTIQNKLNNLVTRSELNELIKDTLSKLLTTPQGN